jgi:hypothetical protein
MDDTERGPNPENESRNFLNAVRFGVVNYVEGKLEKRRARREKESPTERAERRTANATWFIGILTLVIAAVGAAQWYVLTGTLDEMRAEQRPWLKAVPRIVGPLSVKAGLLSMNIAIDVKNGGHLPASGIRGAAMIINTGNWVVTKEDLKETCDWAATAGVLDSDTGAYLVFPDDAGTIVAQAPDQKALRGETAEVTKDGDAIISGDLELVFCAVYASASDAIPHHTGGAFVIQGSKIAHTLSEGARIDQSDLSLVRPPYTFNWRTYAD